MYSKQGVLYASSSSSGDPKARLETAISALLRCFPIELSEQNNANRRHPRVLYTVYYEQNAGPSGNLCQGNMFELGCPVVDLAFNDKELDNVEDAWRVVMGFSAGDQESQHPTGSFMLFEEREHMGEEKDYDGT